MHLIAGIWRHAQNEQIESRNVQHDGYEADNLS